MGERLGAVWPANHIVYSEAQIRPPAATMTIFARYVFRQAAGALLLILISLSGIIWISLALRELNVVTSQGQSTWTLLSMTTLALPNFMAIIAPFALLIAVMHTLNRLNSDSELIVLTASGATLRAVAQPLLALGLAVFVFVSLVNHWAMPWSLRILREIIVEVRADLLTQVIQPGRFSSPEQGLTFHIRARTLNGVLEGLVMHDAREPKEVQTYLAEQGIIVRQDPSAFLVMTAGHIMRRSKDGGPSQIIAFDKYAVDLNSLNEKEDEEAFDLKPRERYLSELIRPEPESRSYRQSPSRFTAEVHERFSSPFYPIAFVLIGLAAVGQAQSTRQNRVERMVVGVAAAAGLRMTGLAVNNLVVINAAMAPLLYAVPLGACVLSLLVIAKGSRLRRGGPTLRDRVSDLTAPLVTLVRDRFLARGLKTRAG